MVTPTLQATVCLSIHAPKVVTLLVPRGEGELCRSPAPALRRITHLFVEGPVPLSDVNENRKTQIDQNFPTEEIREIPTPRNSESSASPFFRVAIPREDVTLPRKSHPGSSVGQSNGFLIRTGQFIPNRLTWSHTINVLIISMLHR